MGYLPYDQRGNDLLCAWNAALARREAAQQAVHASPVSVAALDAALDEARAACREAKVAHDRYRYQQRNPTHSVCASVLLANDTAHQGRPGLVVVVAQYEGTNALAA